MAEPVDDQAFRAAMASFAASVTVITTLDDAGTPFGLTATAFSSVCKDPPTCLVCVGNEAEAEPVIGRARRFAVNVLGAEQQDVSTRFATTGADKFGPTTWAPGTVLGLPCLADAIASIECEVSRAEAMGDHTVYFGLIRSVVTRDGSPLVYFRGSYRRIAGV